jgi:hypothetical protein
MVTNLGVAELGGGDGWAACHDRSGRDRDADCAGPRPVSPRRAILTGLGASLGRADEPGSRQGLYLAKETTAYGNLGGPGRDSVGLVRGATR